MAAGTSLGGALEDIVDMALSTGHAGVRAGQFEGRKIMIKGGRLPGCGRVTGGTNLAKGSVMLILVTGNTTRRRALEDIIDMALGAGHAGVRTSQLEGRNIMVERSRFPGCGGVAIGTNLAKSPVMLIGVAGDTG